ncbi:hypothetical protein [Rhizobium ruizarguesonis]|nr:hypothetical protein [Rhizobium ruizarguesonis]WSH04947.1 hypothetical protein U8P71_34545 [Rhizobium ruizarguesonis]
MVLKIQALSAAQTHTTVAIFLVRRMLPSETEILFLEVTTAGLHDQIFNR